MSLPTPGPRATTSATHVVKVRTDKQTWTSPRLQPTSAVEVAELLRAEILQAGDGPAFVTVGCRDGRNVDVRARDVVAIECGPAGEAGRRPTASWGGDVHLHMTGNLPIPPQAPALPPSAADASPVVPTPAIFGRPRR